MGEAPPPLDEAALPGLYSYIGLQHFPFPPFPEADPMIVEERIYAAIPGKALEYVRMYEAEGLAIQRPILGNLVGYFTSEIGTLNQIVHLWAYEDLADRAARRATLLSDLRWKAYSAKVVPLLLSQENKILVPAPFSPWANGPAY
jgi:hypothetical protein